MIGIEKLEQAHYVNLCHHINPPPLILAMVSSLLNRDDRNQHSHLWIGKMYEYSSFDVCVVNEDFSGVETLYKITNFLVTSVEVSN